MPAEHSTSGHGTGLRQPGSRESLRTQSPRRGRAEWGGLQRQASALRLGT